MDALENRKRRLVDMVDRLAPIWRELALKIHAHPEVALEENQASLWLSDALKNAGFRVTCSVAGMTTSFVALKETSINAPVIVFLAEYDALPGLGHACGHNLSGAASCLAAHALVNAEKDTDLRIRVLGTPGEEDENAAGKVKMIEHGLFDDVEFAMMAHTGFMNLPNRDMQARRNISMDFSVNRSHQDPGEGNALDAVLMTFNALKI
jgi:metal-dependent amidase/aminoacylase/carboxypeptidase family protein